jgi:hypothetical protein
MESPFTVAATSAVVAAFGVVSGLEELHPNIVPAISGATTKYRVGLGLLKSKAYRFHCSAGLSDALVNKVRSKTRHGLSVEVMSPRLTHTKNLADLAKRQATMVIQGDHQFFALGQPIRSLNEDSTYLSALNFAVSIRPFINDQVNQPKPVIGTGADYVF